MDRLIYHNDAIVDVAAAGLSPSIAGVVHGWGVFTNLRVYSGRPFLFEQHWERLIRHAEKARVPVTVDRDMAAGALRQLLEANSVVNGRARLMILKGPTGSWRTDDGRESEFLIFTAQDLKPAPRSVTLTLSPYRVLATGPLAGVKQTAMLDHMLAFEEARSRGFSEALMLNERGEIVCGAAGNIFWVEADELFTPALSTGCVAGITRSLVHEIAGRVNIHIVEGGYPIQRLQDASEAFVTSSLRGIAPVSSFDIKQFDLTQARVARNIAREFQKLTRGVRIQS
jgi:branched-subunit amino acid aminotransferase/4-amino-4-deoxychorismate lyase